MVIKEKRKRKQKQTNVIKAKWYRQTKTPRGYKFAPLLVAILSLVFPVTFRHTTLCRSSPPSFLCSHRFCHQTFCPLFRRLAPFPLVPGCSRPLVGVDTESFEVFQEAPYPLFLFPPTPPTPPTSSPNITHFSNLVSSLRATNPANSIHLLCIIASMLSFSVFFSMSVSEGGSLVVYPLEAAEGQDV